MDSNQKIIFTHTKYHLVCYNDLIGTKGELLMFIYIMAIDTPEDRSKFEIIYRHYAALMFYVANKILNHKQDAEDAVHQAFIKISENIEKISEPICPKTKNYIVTIVENKAIDLYRAKQRHKSVKYIDETAGLSVDALETHDLTSCILKLPARYREVILFKYYHGLSCKEIADHMGITVANAAKLDQRAKHKLLEICKEDGIL